MWNNAQKMHISLCVFFFLKTKQEKAPLYLLLVHSVQFHPPQGLISMCCNLLKKYQTSPDMHRN